MDYKGLTPALRAWFMRRLNNRADVDDAVQDVWLRVEGREEHAEIANPRAYMFQAAQSVLVDRSRRARVRHEKFHEAIEGHADPVEVITPERVLMGKEAIAQVTVKLQKMPERTRDIFVMHRFDSLSYREIADIFGISVSAVEKHIMKALRFLLEDGDA